LSVGDHTLSAAVQAINEVGLNTEQYDESFVIVMSGRGAICER
jgi:hypothetical protein